MSSNNSSYRVPFAILTTLFFMWGFLTALNDIIIPHLKAIFDLNYTQSMLIQFTFFFAYFVMSIPSGSIIERFSYKRGIILGLVTSGFGALLFIPAAYMPSYPLFLFALFVLASGITLLQVAANPYVSVLGPEKTASSRLNLSQAFNSLGTTIAPFLGGLLILQEITSPAIIEAMSPTEYTAFQIDQAKSVQGPYLFLAGTLFVLAILISLFKLPKIKEEPITPEDMKFSAPLKRPFVLLGVIGIFVYVGAEVAIGSFLVNYIDFLGINEIVQNNPLANGYRRLASTFAGVEPAELKGEQLAAAFVSLYWGGAMVGRFIGSALLQRLNAGRLLGIFATIAGGLVILTIATSGATAMWAVLAIGLFNSIMFPTIFTLAIRNLGPLTNQASSLLVMAIVGGALIPLMQGVLADSIGIRLAFLLPIVCYLFIAFYGYHGHQIGQKKD